MAWKIELAPAALKALKQLDPPVARRLLSFLHQRLAPLDDPRSLGAALQGSRFEDLWRYRVGDYRLIARLQDDTLLILVVHIGHRRDVYR